MGIKRETMSAEEFCNDQVFGYGESGVLYDTKESERGITCEDCKKAIREIKSVKL